MGKPETGFFSTETAYLSNREINSRIGSNLFNSPEIIQFRIAEKMTHKMDNSPRIF